MNSRECFQSIINFQKPDRVPLLEIEAYEQETIERWRREGLPPETTVVDYLGLDRKEVVPIDFFPLPRFIRRVIEDNPLYRIEIDDRGITRKIHKEHPSLVYSYLDHPVKNRDDWERMKERFNPRDAGRYPKNWSPELIASYNQAPYPVGLVIHPFFFRLGLFMMGLERFLLAFYDAPELIHDIFSFWADFVKVTISEVIEKVKLDYVTIAEDMAYKHSTHISPQMYREFWFPQIKEVVAFIRSKGIKLVTLWNSGDIRPLMPLFLEAGFNGFWPLECVTGINALELRQEYGSKIVLVGNIAKEALISGKEAIRKEILSKVPVLMEQGGYIPTVDDLIPPEVSFENYIYYINLLRDLKLS